MKKIAIILIAFYFNIWNIEAFAISGTADILIREQQCEEPDIKDENAKGPRMPSAPMRCTIDFDNQCIETSIPYLITAYELWVEDGTTQVVSYPDDYELVEYMSGAYGVFQLRLITSGPTYTGYIDL